MKKAACLLIVLAAAKISFSQDTTGGTRPNIVIPLHKTPEKPASGGIPQPLADTGSYPLNATDRKLRAAANSKKYRRRAQAVRKATPVTPQVVLPQ